MQAVNLTKAIHERCSQYTAAIRRPGTGGETCGPTAYKGQTCSVWSHDICIGSRLEHDEAAIWCPDDGGMVQRQGAQLTLAAAICIHDPQAFVNLGTLVVTFERDIPTIWREDRHVALRNYASREQINVATTIRVNQSNALIT